MSNLVKTLRKILLTRNISQSITNFMRCFFVELFIYKIRKYKKTKALTHLAECEINQGFEKSEAEGLPQRLGLEVRNASVSFHCRRRRRGRLRRRSSYPMEPRRECRRSRRR